MIFQQVWNWRLFEAIWLALVFVMILHWLKKAAISNFLEDHAPKLEQFVFTLIYFTYLLDRLFQLHIWIHIQDTENHNGTLVNIISKGIEGQSLPVYEGLPWFGYDISWWLYVVTFVRYCKHCIYIQFDKSACHFDSCF